MQPERDTQCITCGKWTHRLTPGGLGVIYCSENCRNGIQPERDTPCDNCGKWTHSLTPGGLGILYCGAACERSRMRGLRL